MKTKLINGQKLKVSRNLTCSNCSRAIQILLDGLEYHEHDGHDMPKSVAREALIALGVSLKEQYGEEGPK